MAVHSSTCGVWDARRSLATSCLAVGLLTTLTILTACGGRVAPALQDRLTPPVTGTNAASGALPDDPSLSGMPRDVLVVPKRPVRAPQPATSGNVAVAYVSPVETMPAVKALIASARNSIYLETYNFGYDSYGRQLVPLLVAKSRQGIAVNVVMDYLGSRFIAGHAEMLDTLREAGVDVRLYWPRTIVKDDQRIGINITHRKVYLADGERALIGGVNLKHGFDTINQDILVDLRGPVVAQLYQEFERDWLAVGGGPLKQKIRPVTVSGPVRAQVVVTSPREGRYEARDAIYAGIDAARREIAIENQYLWDDHLMVRLHAAVKRGVKLRVLIPGAEHKAIFKNIHTEELRSLEAEGAQARTYKGIVPDAHLHVKYYGVDGAWCAIGSTNGDTRAYLDNQELQVILQDAAFAKNLQKRLFERDWTEFSEPFVYTPSNLVTRPFRSLLELLDYYL